VGVLTNGSMLWVPEVRASLAEADVVMPSLDAGNPRTFEWVNRPHPNISFDRMVNGLLAFAEGFRGEIWLEVFVLGGITDHVAELSQIATIARKLRPARVQLNTVSRPPAEVDALAVPAASLEQLAGLFAGNCEVIAEAPRATPAGPTADRNAGDEILALLARRPCTVEGIAAGLALRPSEVIKCLDRLRRCGAVDAVWSAGEFFYERIDGPGCSTERTGSASERQP
jgi:wyosine [tRNA(Phe)-imidazoG37] synthetase (radical SAM superfamily)